MLRTGPHGCETYKTRKVNKIILGERATEESMVVVIMLGAVAVAQWDMCYTMPSMWGSRIRKSLRNFCATTFLGGYGGHCTNSSTSVNREVHFLFCFSSELELFL
jgi:hypothetical protein